MKKGLYKKLIGDVKLDDPLIFTNYIKENTGKAKTSDPFEGI